MKKQSGFTLIELMIVVAIIGVLSAIAVPQYQKYVERSEAATALASISSLKSAVELNIAESGVFPEADDTEHSEAKATYGIPESTLGSISLIPESTSSAEGIIKFQFTSGQNAKIVQLVRSDTGAWACESSFGDSIPSGCSELTIEKN